MPNIHSTLTGLFTDIANAIRSKTGTVGTLVADTFPTAIEAIPSGGDTSVENALVTRTISEYTNSTVSEIGSFAFTGCYSLAAVAFPMCTYIDFDAFDGCPLTSISFPACTMIGISAFNYCYLLTSVSFPTCTYIGENAFENCSSLSSVSFPMCDTIGGSAFNCCSSLTSVSLPTCTYIGGFAFNSCSSLTSASFPACTFISWFAFNNCYNLLSLYLGASTVCSMQTRDAFTSTPIAGYTAYTGGVYGSIFVPASLVDAYKSNGNWSYLADRITAIPET